KSVVENVRYFKCSSMSSLFLFSLRLIPWLHDGIVLFTIKDPDKGSSDEIKNLKVYSYYFSTTNIVS
ncbi:MAG TPA: hypothetical protein VFN95_16640, partial [Flavitalea sp.]|nr:hypothetical protein [Flavitalea sp.]